MECLYIRSRMHHHVFSLLLLLLLFPGQSFRFRLRLTLKVYKRPELQHFVRIVDGEVDLAEDTPRHSDETHRKRKTRSYLSGLVFSTTALFLCSCYLVALAANFPLQVVEALLPSLFEVCLQSIQVVDCESHLRRVTSHLEGVGLGQLVGDVGQGGQVGEGGQVVGQLGHPWGK